MKAYIIGPLLMVLLLGAGLFWGLSKEKEIEMSRQDRFIAACKANGGSITHRFGGWIGTVPLECNGAVAR